MRAGAQSTVTLKQGELQSSGSINSIGFDKNLMMGNNDILTMPIQKDKYDDNKLKELEKRMEERDWESEGTAWERADLIGTKDAYLKYIGLFPNGAHRAQAEKKMIDARVKELLSGTHQELPGIKRVVEDDDSPESTIVIYNRTGYPLTVWFSGEIGTSVRIIPDGRDSVTVPNGTYNIAASVPPARIRPFAGAGTVSGGQYEVSFYVTEGPPPVPSNPNWIH